MVSSKITKLLLGILVVAQGNGSDLKPDFRLTIRSCETMTNVPQTFALIVLIQAPKGTCSIHF